MINKVILSGRLVKDVDLKRTKENDAVANFTLATSYYTKEDPKGATYVDCTAFSQIAETLAKYTHKGSYVYVIGRIYKTCYKTKTNENRYKTIVVIESIDLPPAQTTTTPKKEVEERKDIIFNDDDLPF